MPAIPAFDRDAQRAASAGLRTDSPNDRVQVHIKTRELLDLGVLAQGDLVSAYAGDDQLVPKPLLVAVDIAQITLSCRSELRPAYTVRAILSRHGEER